MQWIIGLGNPGPRYQLTRHNAGFMALDAWAFATEPSGRWKQQMKAEILRIQKPDILLVKPQTFMNLSGDAARLIYDFYKLDLSKLLVVHDEADIPFGEIRFQKNRGHGGHNGVRDLHLKLGSSDYTRLKIGVGKDPTGRLGTADFLLSPFSSEEQIVLKDDLLGLLIDAIDCWMTEGFEKAANQWNSKKVDL